MEEATFEMLARLCIPQSTFVWMAVALVAFIWSAAVLIWQDARTSRASNIALVCACLVAMAIFIANIIAFVHHMGRNFVARVGF